MPRFWRRIALIFVLSLAGAGAYVFWNRATLQRRLIRATIARIQPSFPMRIEDVEIDSSWTKLSFHLSGHGWELRFSGPFELHSLEVHYSPELVATHGREHFAKLPLDIRAKIAPDLLSASELRLESAPKSWSHDGIKLEEPHLIIAWQGEDATLSFDAKSVAYRDQVSVPEVSVRASVPLTLSPLRVGPTATVSIHAKESEALFGETYLDVPFQKLPIQISASLAALTLTTPHVELMAKPDGSFRHWQIHWKATQLNLPALARELAKSSPFSALASYPLEGGKMDSEGDLQLGLLQGRAPVYSLRGRVRARGVAIRAPAFQAAAHGVDLDLPLELDSRSGRIATPGGARLSIARFGFRGLRGSLAPLHVAYDSPKLQIAGPIPLKIDGVPLEIGAISGALQGSRYRLQTSLELAPTQIEPLLRQACVSSRVPPSQVEIHFPTLKLANGTIDPTGEVMVRAFQGQVVLKEIGLYDLDSEVPEVFFDADWKGFQLADIGRYLHIGKMGGTVTGYAHDVVVQGWLPTQFDFKLQALPAKKHIWDSDGIVMSSHSVLNLIEILTGEKLKLPGILRALYFGKLYDWTGGYDLRYAGLTLSSHNGSILLKTLDPPDVLEIENGKHFVLYGRRVKMPIRSPHYPVVMDSTALGNFVRQLSDRARSLVKTKDAEGEDLAPEETTHERTQKELSCPAPL